MSHIVNLSSGESYAAELRVINVTGIAEERGFRLVWRNPDSDCYTPALGLATSNPFRTMRAAIAYGERTWGEKARYWRA